MTLIIRQRRQREDQFALVGDLPDAGRLRWADGAGVKKSRPARRGSMDYSRCISALGGGISQTEAVPTALMPHRAGREPPGSRKSSGRGFT